MVLCAWSPGLCRTPGGDEAGGGVTKVIVQVLQALRTDLPVKALDTKVPYDNTLLQPAVQVYLGRN